MIRSQDSLNLAGGAVAIGLLLILAFVAWALVFVSVPNDNQNALSLLLGILSAGVGTIVGFYFGSSAQTKKQADTINTLAQTARTAGAALPGVADAGTTSIELQPGETAKVTAEDGA